MSTIRRVLSKMRLNQKSEKNEKEEETEDPATVIRKIGDTFSIFLCDLLNYLEDQRIESHKFDPKLFKGIGVIFETFNADNQSLCADDDEHTTFFLPMDLEALKTYKPDLSQPWADDLLKGRLGEWETPEESLYPEDSYHNAGELCQALDIAFSSIPYKKSGEDGCQFLCDLTAWKAIDGWEAFSDPRGFDAEPCWKDEWRSQPEEVWAAKNKPHMMVSMRHHYKHDDNSLFVSEIEVIIALMIVRLVSGSFLPDHNVVPVMLFSFTADKRGRILQAHMNEKSLVIRASGFYDFSAKVDAHLSLFVRYMMSGLQGTTKICDRPEIKSSIAQEAYTIKSLEASGDIK